MTINEMAEKAHNNAKDKGFYLSTETALKVAENYTEESGDDMYSHIKDAFIAQRLALIHSEVSEALEAARDNRLERTCYCTDDELEEMTDTSFAIHYKECFKDRFAADLAGTMIRLGDLANWLGIDLQRAVELEMRYNSTRAHKHGKSY